MNSQKSTRNKTIHTSIADGQDYFNKCISISDKIEKIQMIKNKTICGDLFHIIPMLPEKSMDLIIADPPYNLTKKFGENTFNKTNNDEYEQYTRDWLNLVVPLLKDNGSIYICCDWESSLIIGQVLSEFAIVRNRISWQREKGRGAKANWKNGMEDIWFATKSKQYTFNLDAVKVRRKVIAPYKINGKPKDWTENINGNYRDTCPSNFWDDITIPFWSMPENTAHPTQKPEKLIAKLILASSNQGDIVFDPFLGSGTTVVVAKKLNRNYLGIEKEPQYCIWTEQRLQMAENNSYIQGYTNGVFWERNSLSEQNGQKKRNVLNKNKKFALIG